MKFCHWFHLLPHLQMHWDQNAQPERIPPLRAGPRADIQKQLGREYLLLLSRHA